MSTGGAAFGLAPDAIDTWFETSLNVPGDDKSKKDVELFFPGIWGVGEIYVDGLRIAEFSGSFLLIRSVVPLQGGSHTVSIRCAALKAIKTPRKPRARWLSSLVSDRTLRWHRVPLVGRFDWPGTTPVLGPEPGASARILAPRLTALRTTVKLSENQRAGMGSSGTVECTVEAIDSAEGRLMLRLCDPSGEEILLRPVGKETEQLVVDSPLLWNPVGYGTPNLYGLELVSCGPAGPVVLERHRLGFRKVQWAGGDVAPTLLVNGSRIFAGGVVWQPPNPHAVASTAEEAIPALDLLAEAGVRMLRVPGTHGYESEAFYEECSRRGLLVWQDAPLASFDYPSDREWLESFGRECRTQAIRIAAHPCAVVLCGGTEVLQQSEMFGLPSGVDVPALQAVRTAAEEAGLLPVDSSPSGGVPCIRVDYGFSHYFGVGAYLRPLTDARTSRVRFASECLAFGVGPEPSRQALVEAQVHAETHQGTLAPMKDPSAEWTFQDVSIDYARRFFPYYDSVGEDFRGHLERAAVALAISTTMSWWRWSGSGTSGALVLGSQDLSDGPDWGVLDRGGEPKAGWFALARSLRPTSLSFADEGLNGLHLDIFLPEGRARPVSEDAQLVVTVVDRVGTVTESATTTLREARSVAVGNTQGTETCYPGGTRSFRLHLETLLGGFRDVDHAWGFGQQQRFAVMAELWAPEGTRTTTGYPWAQSAYLLGLGPEKVHHLDPDLEVSARFVDERTVAIRSTRPAASVSLTLVPNPGTRGQGMSGEDFLKSVPVPLDGYFDLAPGLDRYVRLSSSVETERVKIVLRTASNEKEY